MLKRNSIDVHIDKNALADDGDGVISFPKGQVIVDDTEMWSGYKYDINSLDIAQYDRQLTADHVDRIDSLIGEVSEPYKKGKKVLVDSIRFAVKESAAGRLAYDLMRGGFLKSFSVETIGPWPGEDDFTYHDASLVGLSAVVVGNNKSARINQLVLNSIAQSKEAGLDTTKLEEALQPEEPPAPPKKPKKVKQENNNPKQESEDMKFVTIENPRDFPVAVTYKNAAGAEVKTELAPKASVDVSEEQKEAVEKQLNDAKAPQAAQPDVAAVVKQELDKARKEDTERVEKLEKELKTYKETFDKGAQEPELRKPEDHEVRLNAMGGTTKLGQMDWKERTALQIRSLYNAGKGNMAAANTANAINGFHLEQLQKANKASNSLTLTDLGNFVIAPEMATQIEGFVSDYRPLVNRFGFQETLSLVTSWIERTGEVDMEDVDMEDHGDNADLKPISEPGYSTHTSTLKEFAAVTPVDASAVRFSAIDIVQDITSMYRTAYDRALSRSIIGRLEKAIEGNGNSVTYDFSTANGGNVGALVSLIRAWGEVAEHTPNGLFLMTENSFLHLLEMSLRAGTNGPLANLFMTDPNGVQRFLNKEYLVVPGDLLPSLNTASTKSWTFEGTSVTVNHGVIYASPTNFKGRVSGGLNFQVSTEAAYEQGGVVKSGYQRDKLVFRGYGFRSSAVTNTSDVAGILSPGVS